MTNLAADLFALAGNHPWASAVTFILSILSLAYWWLTSTYGKFEAKGLFSVKPELFFGNEKDVFLQRKGMMDVYFDLYQKFKGHKYGIIYLGREACFFAKHPDITKQIMIKDFDHFTNFGFFSDSLATMPINDMGLVNMTGERWRSLKAAIVPAFSLRNMKHVTPQVNEIARQVLLLAKERGGEGDVDVEQIVSGFAMECITRIAFGISVDAAKNPENEISKAADVMVETWRFALASFAPWVMWLFNISILNHKSVVVLTQLGRDIIAGRDKRASEGTEEPKENDVIGLMMKLRSGDIKSGEEEEEKEKEELGLGKAGSQKYRLSDEDIAKTIMQFFMDGYDTVSSSMSLLVYFLATNPDVQHRATEEVDKMVKKMETEGRTLLQGDNANELQYLDQVVSEAQRLGSFPITGRVCTKDWQIPNTDVIIPKGMRVIIPIFGLHTDPSLFPDPQKFNPDRFSSENRSTIATGSYLPFGTGPRQCIGMKIARLESKVFIFQMLRQYTVELADRTKNPIVWRTDHFNRIEGGCWVRFTERKKC